MKTRPTERTERLSAPLLRPGMHIHLVGVGGTGLSAIAQVLLGRGYVVSGSDRDLNEMTARLEIAGAHIYEGHAAEQIVGADLLLISSAIPADNPEVQAAKATGKPVLKRNVFLDLLMNDSFGIAVAGTHGKTTTTGMIGQVMIDAGLDPTLIVGAELPVLASNGRAGEGDYFIVEADEYDHMFLGLRPNLAVVTNVEYDHPDLFPSPNDYRAAFMEFAERIRNGGHLIACADDPGSQSLSEYATSLPLQIETYGLKNGHWQAIEVRSNQLGGSDFLVRHNDETIGLARLRVPGEHNVLNALAAIAAATTVGVKFDTIRSALGTFDGLGRRFQVVGEIGDVAIVDDYAHHPTEIKATLAAARQRFSRRRIWAIWQPHTFSRTKTMIGEFADCFKQADRVVVMDIYRSRERETLGVESIQLVKQINNAQVSYASSIDEAVDYLFDRVTPGDVVITLSAGDGNLVGEKLLLRLEERVRSVNGVPGTKRT